MMTNCGPACQTCEQMSINTRCPMDRDLIGPDIWSAGDLNKMFERITAEPFLSQYDVKILSSPDTYEGGPWVITMDNFVNDEEADRLIELGSIEGYVRSTDVGPMKPDGSTEEIVSTGRTSTNAWCSNDCIKDEFVKAVTGRISNMTQFPELNSEDLQLLRYEPGQK
ncbi:MAG: prolyl 4-hydroxylase [Bacillariaceae sp.]|jgi:prolyl 4-hydroxylase